ncbi:MAG TPA: hypothetical protein VGR03_11715 [Candidatus Acidoferrum sp.]|nr:hypothetical protein [Candidatus Acidoferrum sp.]
MRRAKLSEMSLVIAKVPEPDFVESAWLVAVTCTVAGDGRSVGAVYTPRDVIVPSVAFPPGTPFTLQLTAVSVVLVTVAAKVAWPPSTTDPLAGFTVTSIVGGAVEVAASSPHRSRTSTLPPQEVR